MSCGTQNTRYIWVVVCSIPCSSLAGIAAENSRFPHSFGAFHSLSVFRLLTAQNFVDFMIHDHVVIEADMSLFSTWVGQQHFDLTRFSARTTHTTYTSM